uniref:Uncharacterized protein n=1 Tax=Aegilops tauschii subsp. strangulata TaxID=200361 RepID=A0A452YNL3_AEGTS
MSFDERIVCCSFPAFRIFSVKHENDGVTFRIDMGFEFESHIRGIHGGYLLT